MRPHHGGGRVVAHARHRLGGQVAGTGIRHGRGSTAPSIAMAPHRVTMIEPSFRARLMPRVRRPAGPTVASGAAVDLASIVALADVEDHRAPRARNRDQNANRLHARTSMAALIEVAPPARSRAPSPGLRPRATRRLRALHLGLHLFRGHRSLRDAVTRRHFSADGSMRRFLRISATVKTGSCSHRICRLMRPPARGADRIFAGSCSQVSDPFAGSCSQAAGRATEQ